MKKLATVIFLLFLVLIINAQHSTSRYILTPLPMKTGALILEGFYLAVRE